MMGPCPFKNDHWERMKKDKTKAEQISAVNEQSDDEDYLRVAAKNIALSIFDQGRTRTNALQLTSMALGFATDILGQIESKESMSEPLACKTGCCYCCFYQVLLIPPEALLIGNYVDEVYTDQDKQDLMERIETTLRLTEGKSIQERVKIWHNTPCIFLSDRRCSVYHVRPFICRAWHSLNSDECTKAFESNEPWVEIDNYQYRYYIFRAAREGIQEACVKIWTARLTR